MVVTFNKERVIVMNKLGMGVKYMSPSLIPITSIMAVSLFINFAFSSLHEGFLLKYWRLLHYETLHRKHRLF